MRIAVAMSGGMDSTAAALLLRKDGHDVVGLHMNLHTRSQASWVSAQEAARLAGISIHRVDLSSEFRDTVIKPFVSAYARGRTPSPCLICNRHIKMTLLFDQARSLGYQKLATGHYARIQPDTDMPVLMKGKDPAKDQSYFLSLLTREMLGRTLFPMGEYTKDQTRRLLRHEGICVWESDESQELCFVPDGNYREFLLNEGVMPRPGFIVDAHGRPLGKHQGIMGFTVGQRRGLGISAKEPLYVLRIDSTTDTVMVGTKEQTFVSTLIIQNFNRLRPDTISIGEQFEVKVRSTAKPAPCTVEEASGDRLSLIFEDYQSGVALGQAAVLYSEDRVVGGGWIEDCIQG